MTFTLLICVIFKNEHLFLKRKDYTNMCLTIKVLLSKKKKKTIKVLIFLSDVKGSTTDVGVRKRKKKDNKPLI